jgi:hypothetical protein
MRRYVRGLSAATVMAKEALDASDGERPPAARAVQDDKERGLRKRFPCSWSWSFIVQVCFQRCPSGIWCHGVALPAALPASDEDLFAAPVQVAEAQAKSLREAQTCAHQQRNQRTVTVGVKRGREGRHFWSRCGAREWSRNTQGRGRATTLAVMRPWWPVSRYGVPRGEAVCLGPVIELRQRHQTAVKRRWSDRR